MCEECGNSTCDLWGFWFGRKDFEFCSEKCLEKYFADRGIKRIESESEAFANADKA